MHAFLQTDELPTLTKISAVVFLTRQISLDVRSDYNGTILATFGEPGDAIEVGEDLFKIKILDEATAAELAGDSSDESPGAATATEDAAPTTTPTSAPTTTSTVETSSTTQPSSSSTSHAAVGRRPLIHFRYGDRAAIDAEMNVQLAASASETTETQTTAGFGHELLERPSPRFARKQMTEEEIEAVVSGGAMLWN